jgi:hypothetical protein
VPSSGLVRLSSWGSQTVDVQLLNYWSVWRAGQLEEYKLRLPSLV